MSLSDYLDNVGEIVLRKDECFWIFPSEYYSSVIDIYSPWFSYVGEKWRLVKPKRNSGTDFIFRLWRKRRSNLLKYKYTIQLSLTATCGNQLVVNTNRDLDPDYGCELRFSYFECLCGLPLNHIVYKNGLMKLRFDIQKQKRIKNSTEKRGEESTNEVEENNSDEQEESSADEMDSDEEGTSREKKIAAETKAIKRLAENFKQIFLDGELSDTVVKVEDREFNVHKLVLAARSPVFASMFKHDLAEKKKNVVNIPDCTAESFEVFLHYLYCGSCESMSTSNVYNVYYAADKYQVDDLKENCVKFMKKNLSLETICDIIDLSLLHGEAKLQKAATGFFCENITKILKTVQWQKYLAKNPTHANELLIYFYFPSSPGIRG